MIGERERAWDQRKGWSRGNAKKSDERGGWRRTRRARRRVVRKKRPVSQISFASSDASLAPRSAFGDQVQRVPMGEMPGFRGGIRRANATKNSGQMAGVG